ncbi:MAG: phosphatidylserine/phosphatidylglycerophosphate/cardiolipin synthase family protein [SAR202 cluster bacterium]|nr:phosphatidylserine/phosphatidylglycerophosphate/cardiolipin synthase family protein [SAR202 cluster bacterium]
MTTKKPPSVFVDSEVSTQILGVINEARQYVVIVSPYLRMWGHARRAVEQALRRGVRVSMYLRDDQDKPPLDQIQWLVSNGVSVFAVQGLHAKVYMNEQTVLLSSMNFTESSALNSLEIAYLVRDSEHAQRIREYVASDITTQAVQIPNISDSPPGSQRAQPASRTPGTLGQDSASAAEGTSTLNR